jgi:5-carboxymethyl-2-hydroxymuconate isomerase
MPHLTLEYTENLAHQEVHFAELFLALHQVLADVGGIRIGNCKSRAVELSDYCVGQGQAESAFVHLGVRFMEGRPLELKQEIGQQLLGILKEHYALALAERGLQITVEIADIQQGAYFKIPEGTLTPQA